MLERFDQSWVFLEVCVELCEGGVAVRFPSAVSGEVGIGHHAVERVGVNVIEACVLARGIARGNPRYITVDYQN